MKIKHNFLSAFSLLWMENSKRSLCNMVVKGLKVYFTLSSVLSNMGVKGLTVCGNTITFLYHGEDSSILPLIQGESVSPRITV